MAASKTFDFDIQAAEGMPVRTLMQGDVVQLVGFTEKAWVVGFPYENLIEVRMALGHAPRRYEAHRLIFVRHAMPNEKYYVE